MQPVVVVKGQRVMAEDLCGLNLEHDIILYQSGPMDAGSD